MKTTEAIQVLQDKKWRNNMKSSDNYETYIFQSFVITIYSYVLDENGQSSESSQQDIWLQVSPLARPTYGYADQGIFSFYFGLD